MKNVVKTILFVLGLVVIINVISFLLIPKQNIKKYGMLKTAKYEILAEKENTIDTIVVGDSLVYSAISPMEIWHNYGYTVYDCASPAQVMSENYNDIKVAIESQSPNVIFLEADGLFRNVRKQKWKNYYKRQLEYFAPIINYHNNWKKGIVNFLDSDSNINIYKGYKYITKVKPVTKKVQKKYTNEMKHTTTGENIPDDNLNYFKKIIALCNKNNIKLVFISLPNMKTWSYSKHIEVEKLAKEYNLEFIDFNIDNVLNIDWKKETKDKGGHLNYGGALKASKFIGEYLKNNNLVVSHKNDDDYTSWDKAYMAYKEDLKKNNN